MAWIVSYGCATAAGSSVESLWQGLQGTSTFAKAWPGEAGVQACLFPESGRESIEELLLYRMHGAWSEARAGLKGPVNEDKLGVIFASTKGMSDDFIWTEAREEDPLTPLLRGFLRQEGLKPKRQIVVSNACSSGLAAIALAQAWLSRDVETVVILAADAVTRFVIQGFQTLKLVSDKRPEPFGKDRGGFFLGDAAACLILSRDPEEGALRVLPVGLDTEGAAVTRPSHSGESLMRAAQRIPDFQQKKPDLIVAHGTGTIINDETEDLAFAKLFRRDGPMITGTKWCIGHTLGASAAIDTIAACEVLRRQKVFRLQMTEVIDGSFHSHYLTKNSFEAPTKLERVMLSSLGFGGMHATALLEGPWS